ncbi:MAG: Cyclopropane-fatty-acyl-phospholipid synthase [Hydrocarboniphaga sp.]|uniref:SAM-dependent methyltransferase n=1 Tax=Hydrocarboniphaga sp. TaxID=2033016 RepID=UPI00260B0BFA|nr:cyclopropane-fatty-acyl-phospholipid synthase family protein [Hydrocarboniphaga sp.]MDB5968587.1 Cyclopropane-fatty-acyl-phospholipid synthase [Hydrocarboniphaga sp.]
MQRILDVLSQKADKGTLKIHAPDGKVLSVGHGQPEAAVRVTDLSAFLRALMSPGLRIGESYMAGEWEPLDGDLMAVLRVGMGLTRGLPTPGGKLGKRIKKRWKRLRAGLREFNTLRSSRRNVAHHYDLDHGLYAAFLDTGLFYSCAYFREPDMSLEQAQQAKCAHIAAKLDLRPGARVLDIGCGWGGLAMHIAEHHTGVHVTGITLSVEQLAIAQQRVRDRGLEDRIELRLEDYRDTPGSFDAIVSVGMFEHVGRPQFQTFFDRVKALLKPDGTALIHTIGRAKPRGVTNPWLAKYIFPGGYIPSASEVLSAIEPSKLLVSDMEVWRLHYAYTLAEWNRRFQLQREPFRERLGERFCRMWEFYLQTSEASFRWGNMVVFHFQLVREQTRLPLTRDYLYAPDGAAAGQSQSRVS